MSNTTWDRFELAGRSREKFRAALLDISEEFRGGFIRNYVALEKRYVCGEIDGETFRRSVALMRADVETVSTVGKGK